MKKNLFDTKGKHLEGEAGVMKILAESRRKSEEAADQLRKEIEEEKHLKKIEEIKMRELKSYESLLSVRGNPTVKNENQEASNIWKWFQPMPESVRLAIAESVGKNLFEKGFEKIQRLVPVLEQNDWLSDPEKGLLRFRERCGELLSNCGGWLGKDFGEEDFRSPPWLQAVKERFDEILKLVRWSPSAQNTEGQSPEETPRSVLSPFKDHGALFGFSNIRSGFGQAEGDLPKSMNGLNKYAPTLQHTTA